MTLLGDPDGRERMLLGTGIEKNDVVVPTETLKVRTSQQSASYVAAHQGHLAATIDQLEQDGHRLWFMWHSHPTTGRAGTQPSGTDLAHQERLAKFGMPHVMGGICNRDGWFRLFNPAEDFALALFGKDGVDIVTDQPRENCSRST